MRPTNEQDLLNDAVHASLKLDPLSEAEKITGKSYKECEATSGLGTLFHFQHVQDKRKLLEATGDLSHCCTWNHFLDFMKSMEFELVLEDKFTYSCFGQEESEEVCQLWWNDERGIICWAESYSGQTSLNAAKFYGCCKLKDHKYTSSGGYKATPEVTKRSREYDEVWSATARIAKFDRDLYDSITHDQIAEKIGITVEEVQKRIDGKPDWDEFTWVGNWHHEGIRHNITMIDEFSKWEREWVVRPFLWFASYKETKVEGYDYEAITEERISRLPQHIQDCITPKDNQ